MSNGFGALAITADQDAAKDNDCACTCIYLVTESSECETV